MNESETLIPVPGGTNDGWLASDILGKCCRAARRAGWTSEQVDAFQHEATSGDYDHLLQTVLRSFDLE